MFNCNPGIRTKQPVMKTKTLLVFLMIIVLRSLQPGYCQNTTQKVTNAQLPFYFKELQRGLPPEEMKVTEPKLYEHLLKRRAMLTRMLQKEVHDKRLPETALDILKPAEPVSYIKTAENNSINKTESSNIHLVKDINHATNSNPANNLRGFKNTFAVLKKCVYYAANDGIHGTELWRSDGTEAGTYMVKDINDNDTSSSYPSYITAFQDKIYFRAYNPATGYEMYQSDGTADGTNLFKDIDIGASSSYPGQFTIVKSKLYFVSDGASVLWKTDGTPEGTMVVKDLGDYWLSGISQLTAVNNLLFFSADSPDYSGEYETHDRELWRSDGTSDGTIQLQYADDAEPDNFTSFNDHLFFTENPTHLSGYTLWVSDGTVAGTNEISNPNNVSVNSYHSYYSYDYQYQTIPLPIAHNCLFFAGSNSKTGNELYKYDTSKGIVLVKDITPGAAASDFSTESLRSMNDNIYFSLPDSGYKNFSFWKSGGYEGNTRSIKTLPGNINPYSFYVADSTLYFSFNYSNNNEPWVSDGTASGTKILKDVNPLAGSGSSYFTACNGKVFFSAYTDDNGQELWVTNAAKTSAKLVKDMNTTAITGSAVYSAGMALDSNTLIFTAYTTEYGFELWKTDGTDAGTVLIKDINPGEHSSNPNVYAVVNGKAYFGAYDEATDSEAVYVTDGTAIGTKKITSSRDDVFNIRVADNGNVFYATGRHEESDYRYYYSLRKTDSTSISLTLGFNIDPENFNIIDNNCFFSDYGDPYVSDGTVHGTHIFTDINIPYGYGGPYGYTPFNNKTIFATAFGLYKTNGTQKGTRQLSSIVPQLYYGDTFPKFQGKLYFVGYDTTYHIYGLYSTNSTIAGTVVVNNGLAYTPYSSSRFAVGDNVLYFTTNSTELWKVKGTKPPTASLVKNIDHTVSNFYITDLVATGDKAYFLYKGKLWKSNGTQDGTKEINNTVLSGLQSIDYLTAVGNKLFFVGGNSTLGNELYVNENAAGKSNVTENAITKTLTKTTLSAQLITNPFYNDLKINITSPQKQQLMIIVSNTAGQKIISKTIDADAAVNFVSLSSAQWQSGIYLIKVSSSTEAISLKAIK